jgi:diguanylate cyclase
LFGAIILALSKLGVMERNVFYENALQIGTAISVLWLSLALGEYIAQQNRERQKVKEDALEKYPKKGRKNYRLRLKH